MRGLGSPASPLSRAGCAGSPPRRQSRFDVILEKSWLLSGCLSAGGRAPTAASASRSRTSCPARPASAVRASEAPAGRGRAHVGRPMPAPLTAGDRRDASSSRPTSSRSGGVRPIASSVVGLGVDRELFRPHDRKPQARVELGLAAEATRPALCRPAGRDARSRARSFDAVAATRRARARAARCRRRARAGRVSGHSGRRARAGSSFTAGVPHQLVPSWIAAADLCLAPYERQGVRQRARSAIRQ